MNMLLTTGFWSALLVMGTWAALECWFMALVLMFSNGRHSYSVTASMIRLWTGRGDSNVYSPWDVLLLTMSAYQYKRSLNRKKMLFFGTVTEWLVFNQLLLQNRFHLDDEAKASQLNYVKCHKLLLKELLTWSIQHPEHTLNSFLRDSFVRALIHVKENAEIDYALYSQAEVHFMLDEFCEQWRVSVLTRREMAEVLCPMPFYVILAVLAGYSHNDVCEDLLANTRYLGGWMTSMRKHHPSAIRKDLGIQ